MRKLMLAVVLLAGCNGMEGLPADPLDGTAWTSPVNGFYCDLYATFDSGNYQWALGCTLENGQAAAMLERGEYQVFSNVVTFMTREASCPTSVFGNLSVNYVVSRSQLQLTDSTGTLLFTASQSGPPTGGSIVFGCFDDAGAFTPNPITRL